MTALRSHRETRRQSMSKRDRMVEALDYLGVAYLDRDGWQSLHCPICNGKRSLSVRLEYDRVKCFRCGFGWDYRKASSAGLLEAVAMGFTIPEAVTEPPKRKRGRPSKIDAMTRSGRADFSWLSVLVPAGGPYRRSETALDRLDYLVSMAARSNLGLADALHREGMTTDDLLSIMVVYVTADSELVDLVTSRPQLWVWRINAYLWSKNVVSSVRTAGSGVEQVRPILVDDWSPIEIYLSSIWESVPDHFGCSIGLDEGCPFAGLSEDMWIWAHAMIRTLGDRFA